MNIGILLVGLAGALLIGGGIEMQSRAARRRDESLARNGIRLPGTVTAVDAVGKYNSHRRIRVQVGGGEFVETMPFNEADQLGLAVGGTITALVMPNDPATGRIDRPADGARPRSVGLWVGAVIAVLGVLAAFVV